MDGWLTEIRAGVVWHVGFDLLCSASALSQIYGLRMVDVRC